jgi:signal transduction histidine kinase
MRLRRGHTRRETGGDALRTHPGRYLAWVATAAVLLSFVLRPIPREQLLLAAARELLSNVAQHADARDVRMSLAEENGYVVVAIRDDGKGFDEATLSERLAHGHIGIASQKARLESVGGRSMITSSAGRETTAEARVPRA